MVCFCGVLYWMIKQVWVVIEQIYATYLYGPKKFNTSIKSAEIPETMLEFQLSPLSLQSHPYLCCNTRMNAHTIRSWKHCACAVPLPAEWHTAYMLLYSTCPVYMSREHQTEHRQPRMQLIRTTGSVLVCWRQWAERFSVDIECVCLCVFVCASRLHPCYIHTEYICKSRFRVLVYPCCVWIHFPVQWNCTCACVCMWCGVNFCGLRTGNCVRILRACRLVVCRWARVFLCVRYHIILRV